MRIAREKFIADIAGYVKKYAGLYGILVYSPVIAQAVLESGWGESRLVSQYHNYFGLKCGTRWTGRSVNMRTQEEYMEGTLTSIRDNFRVFDSMEEGVKGYFELIQLERYRNLQGIRNPQEYLETIRADGYATSFSYVEDCMKVIRQYELTRFDEGGCETMAKTAESVLDVMRGWLGFSEANGKFKEIIDLYNSVKPLPRGYAVQYSDEWCDTCVSAAGYDYPAVQAKVNELVKSSNKKSVETVAKEVIAGKWGDGEDRKKRLQAAGYDYPAVQIKVNELMR